MIGILSCPGAGPAKPFERTSTGSSRPPRGCDATRAGPTERRAWLRSPACTRNKGASQAVRRDMKRHISLSPLALSGDLTSPAGPGPNGNADLLDAYSRAVVTAVER